MNANPTRSATYLEFALRLLSCNICAMKSLTEHLWFEIPNRRGFVNITTTVEGLVHKSGVREGLCLVNAMHISASVFINDSEDNPLSNPALMKVLTFHIPHGDFTR